MFKVSYNKNAIQIFLIGSMFFITFLNQAQEFRNYFSPEELKSANTAIASRYHTATEKEIFKVLNLARMYPKKFAEFVKSREGITSTDKRNKTNEYVYGLICELEKMKPVSPIVPDKRMFEMAKCWALESGKAGITGHKRTGCAAGYNAECCDYGSSSADQVVLDLLIDLGVKSLGHRKICLSNSYNSVGVSQQPHKTYGVATVLDFTYGADVAVR